MDEGKTHEIRVRVASRALETAQKDYQSAAARCLALGQELGNLQHLHDVSVQRLSQALGESERERERLRIEAEIARGLHEQLKSEQQRHKKALELKNLGGPPAVFETVR
jgi:hypothetical protein